MPASNVDRNSVMIEGTLRAINIPVATGNMFRDIYAKKGYESCLLSRTTEDSVTVTSVLIPWNTCGMTQATILSVPTLVYLPYCFFNIISPLMSIAVAAIGYKIARRS
jgi:Na+:H+ antiporter, NhaC family